MKKILPIVCICLLLFSGCQRTEAVISTPAELAEQLARALQEETPFTAADADYIDSNFEGLGGDGVIYFGNDDDVCEFGIFPIANTDASTAGSVIRTYIAAEAEALASMAQLYPSEELRERLACYRNAYIGEGGGYIYYFIMEDEDTARARRVMEKALGI